MLQGTASVHVEAPPEKVYALVSDVTRTGEWSPECVRAEWVGGATGPAVGAKFKGHNKKGLLRWSTTPEVVTAEPGREFAFKTANTLWSYRMEPSAGGTEVTESFEAIRYGFVDKLIAPEKRRKPELQSGIEQTLQRLKSAAERSAT